MTAKTQTQLGRLTAFWFLAIVCMSFSFPGLLSGSTAPVSDDGLRWASDDLIGPVYAVRVKVSNLRQTENEWIEEESRDEWISTYDRAKLVMEHERLYPNASPHPQKSIRCFARDPQGKIVQSFACNSDRYPIDAFRDVFLYDTQGHLAEYLRINLAESPSLVYREVHEYDAKGQKVAEREYEADGKVHRVVKFDRDPEKNTVTVHDRFGAWEVKERHTFDHMGRRIESISFTPDDQVLSTARMAYDSRGHWIERKSSARGQDFQHVVLYEYDHWGNWIKKTHQEQNGFESRWIIRRTIEYFPD